VTRLPHSALRYGFAVLIWGIALAGRFALADVLPPVGYPFLTFFPAVVLATFLGGFGPGLLATVLSTLAATYYFVPPVGSFALGSTADLIAVVFFVCVLLVDVVVIHVMTTSLARVRQEQARVAELSAARGQLAADLSEGEARLRLALEAGRMGTFDWELATDRLICNERQLALLGLGQERSGGAALDRVHPEDRPRIDAAIAAAGASAGIFEEEFRILHPDGPRWLRGYGRAVPGPDGTTAHFVGLCIDVTRRREAEALLEREAEALERLAEERARALAASEARLAEAARMETLGRLAGGIAHDINNVLQAVQGGLRLARRRIEDPVAAARYLDLAQDALGRGAAVTGRLLAFARRDTLRAEAVEPAALLDSLAAMLRPALGPEIAIRVEAAGAPPLLADRGQLEAVIVNLANNARDAMPRGGPILLRAEAAAAPAPGAPPGLAPGAYLRLSVTDTGEGMSPEVLARVAEPFFTTKPKGQGTGLGLAMAQGFAEQSGGALAIESATGRGTVVSLWLPRAQSRAATPAAPALAPSVARNALAGRVVLLAEDEAAVRLVLRAELEEAGACVAEAPDAPSALRLVDGGVRPDLLVTDLSMPGGDGLSLLRDIRRRMPGLPAVLVTGHTGDAAPDQLAAAAAGGGFAVLRKPIPPGGLAGRVAELVAAAEPAALADAAN